jgi:hypothetical protein
MPKFWHKFKAHRRQNFVSTIPARGFAAGRYRVHPVAGYGFAIEQGTDGNEAHEFCQ